MIDKNRSIMQSNKFLENKPKFTVDETRVFLTMVSIFDEKKPAFEEYMLSVADLADLWGVGINSAYDQFRQAIDGLVGKKFSIDGVDENDKRYFFKGTFLSSSTYVEGEAYATVSIDPKLKPFFLELKKTYTRFVLENVINLNQKHSIRLYELLKQYESIGKRNFTPDRLREFLYLGDKYKGNNFNLRKIAIDPAVKEISEKTDLNVTLEIKGRGPSAIFEFRIQPKGESIPVVPPEADERENDLEEFALEVCIANDIQSTGKEYIRWIEERINHLQVDNRYAYLRKCTTNTANIIEYRNAVEMQQQRSLRRAENEEIVGQIELDFAKTQEEKAEEYFRDLPEFIRDMPEGAKKIQMIQAWKSNPPEEKNKGPEPLSAVMAKKPYVMDPDIKIVNFRDKDED